MDKTRRRSNVPEKAQPRAQTVDIAETLSKLKKVVGKMPKKPGEPLQESKKAAKRQSTETSDAAFKKLKTNASYNKPYTEVAKAKLSRYAKTYMKTSRTVVRNIDDVQQVESPVMVVINDGNKRGRKNRGEGCIVQAKNNSDDEMNSADHTDSESDVESVPEESDEPESAGKSDENIRMLMEVAIANSREKTKNGDPGPSPPKEKKRTRAYNIPCAYCDTVLKDYSYLSRHVARFHKEEPDVDEYLEQIRPHMRTACPFCNRTVSCLANLNAHIKQCHSSSDNAVNCPICNKLYKTEVSLKQHVRQIHQSQNRSFKCNICDASFSENRSLKEHINCTHETTQVFRCEVCGKTFLTKGRLRRHKYIHSDYRHFCSYCKKGFHLKDNMNKHIELMHEKKLGNRYECPHCKKTFAVKGNMNQHVMGVHLRQYQYTCPICGQGFRRKKEMLLHMELHREGTSELKIDDVKIDPHSLKLPPPAIKVQLAPSDGLTRGTTVIEVLPQNITVLTE